MIVTVRKLTSIFVSLAILLTGHGLQQTLLPMAGQMLGWSNAAISLTGAAYFSGFILGCYRIPKWISQVGHARVFAACAGLSVAAILLVAGWQTLPAWLLLRALTGFCFAGLYLIFESWLNEQAPDRLRGSILSLYGFVSLAAMAFGQLLVTADLTAGTMLAATIFALAILPVALTTIAQPSVPQEVELSFRAAYRASQVAPICAAISGFVMGLVWSSGAVFATSSTGDVEAGATFIAFTLLGGLCCQLPLGRLSDWVDRRWVILGVGVTGCATIAIGFAWQDHLTVLYAVGFAIGGTAMPMYSLAIAHANDNAVGQFLPIGGAILVANGIGSIIGPVTYSGFAALGMGRTFLVVVGLAYLAGSAWTVMRLSVHDVPREHYEPYQTVPRTTQAAVELDPRAEANASTTDVDPVETSQILRQ